MRILLISPRNNFPLGYEECPSRALLILGTLAKQHGHDVKIVHQEIEPVDTTGADIVGISVNTFKVKHAKEIAGQCKSKVVIGGPHAAYYDGKADEIVVGPGENRWLEIIGAEPTIESLADVPIPDYSLIDFHKFSGVLPVGNTPSTAIMASRGCPGMCTFCNTPLFWGKKVQYSTVEQVLTEVQILHDHYGMREIFFQDDTFNINQDWAMGIFAEIEKRKLNRDMIFRIACRASFVKEEYLRAASQAGVWSVFYGIESGSQVMLDSMKKHTTVEQARNALLLTRECHIKSQASFIIGMPGESHATIRATGNFLNVARPDMTGVSFACPFPGTEFDRIVTEKGHKRNIVYEDYKYGRILVRTDALDYEFFENFKGFMVN